MGVPPVSNGKAPAARARPSAKEKQDDMIMSTNNSCIVSKRSVEKLYHKDDAGFLRYFVNKFQRRSPLINRGYWLRMRAIEHLVRTFLESDTERPKVVVNLGCGYDTLPFKFLARHAHSCKHTRFVDVDYKQLIQKKCQVIRQTKALSELIPDADFDVPAKACVHLESAHYIAASCDLQSQLDLQALRTATSLDNAAVLFVAEVSMTYMDQHAADGMIKWANSLPDSKFCLLEQYLPDGADSAFGRTMLKHFVKLNSPLKSAMRYPSLNDQRGRFITQGWADVRAGNMWSLWCQDGFLSNEERAELDQVEPFDEWEEFIMFASHYFVLEARQSGLEPPLLPSLELEAEAAGLQGECEEVLTRFETTPGNSGQRRYGASLKLDNATVLNHGGHGTQGRLADADTFTSSSDEQSEHASLRSLPVAELTCHTITRLRSGAYLMVGGRTSPDGQRRTCYLWEQGKGWQATDDLPTGRYRHCAVAAGDGILVFGGKHDSRTLADDTLFWQMGKSWRKVHLRGAEAPTARFGASAAALHEPARLPDGAIVSTLVCGGIDATGRISTDLWGLSDVHEALDGTLQVNCSRIDPAGELLGRFGARLVEAAGELVLVGGCPALGVERGAELVRLDRTFNAKRSSLRVVPDDMNARPMLAGHSVETLQHGEGLLLLGGGAVCFSFGTVWNEGAYVLHLTTPEAAKIPWRICGQTGKTEPGRKSAQPEKQRTVRSSPRSAARPPLPVSKVIGLGSTDDFRRILAAGRPVILRDVDVGTCRTKWSLEYLKRTVGRDRMVTVHQSEARTMSFLDKNFAYAKRGFADFIDSIEHGSLEYMRAVSSTQPGSQATSLEDDFPEVAPDFVLPQELELVRERAHSSVLRISGPVNMWLHYDVMANVLCQVRGRKKLLLYPPRDGSKLGFPAGASSSRIDALDHWQRARPPLRDAQAHEADLEEGDVLFIPALWAHAAAPTENGISVAVNVFFRDLDTGYAAGRDVYGNRDLAAYEQGRKDVAKILRAFKDLPASARDFYLGRLAAEIGEGASR